MSGSILVCHPVLPSLGTCRVWPRGIKPIAASLGSSFCFANWLCLAVFNWGTESSYYSSSQCVLSIALVWASFSGRICRYWQPSLSWMFGKCLYSQRIQAQVWRIQQAIGSCLQPISLPKCTCRMFTLSIVCLFLSRFLGMPWFLIRLLTLDWCLYWFMHVHVHPRFRGVNVWA